jgi:hypothetical protein
MMAHDKTQAPDKAGDREGLAEALREAESLCRALYQKHYREDAPDWQPLSGDLVGLLTQIDNMTAGLTRAATPTPPLSPKGEPRVLSARLIPWEPNSPGGVALVFSDGLQCAMALDPPQFSTDTVLVGPAPVLVPAEPTEAMLMVDVAPEALLTLGSPTLPRVQAWRRAIYRAMLAAAPDAALTPSAPIASTEACNAAWYEYRIGTPENRGPGWNDPSAASAWNAAWKACATHLASAPIAAAGRDDGARAEMWKGRLERVFFDAGGFHGQIVEYAARTALPVVLWACDASNLSSREALAAIEFAQTMDDQGEMREFLERWSAGDTSEWPEFVAFLASLPAPAGDVPGEAQTERVRHLKRGTEYEVLGEAEAQVSTGYTDGWGTSATIRDGNSLKVYRDPTTGKLWCRFTNEFRDGRFVTLVSGEAQTQEGGR